MVYFPIIIYSSSSTSLVFGGANYLHNAYYTGFFKHSGKSKENVSAMRGRKEDWLAQEWRYNEPERNTLNCLTKNVFPAREIFTQHKKVWSRGHSKCSLKHTQKNLLRFSKAFYSSDNTTYVRTYPSGWGNEKGRARTFEEEEGEEVVVVVCV